MKNSIHRGGFELEKEMYGTFLLQGALSGLIILYLYFVYLAISGHARSMFILAIPWLIGVSTGSGILLALLIWLPAEILDLEANTASRIALSVNYFMLLLIVYQLLTYRLSTEDFGVGICVAVTIGVITGSVIGSRVRPWGFLNAGTIEIGDGEYTYRVTPTRKSALWGSLPLRLVTLLTLLVSVLVAVYLWGIGDEPRATHPRIRLTFSACAVIFMVLYSLASAYLSFRTPQRRIFIILGSLLNLPFLMFRLNCYLDPDTTKFDELFVLGAIFVGLWLLCLVTRTRVLLAPSVFSDPRELRLGQQYSEWETSLQVVNEAHVVTSLK